MSEDEPQPRCAFICTVDGADQRGGIFSPDTFFAKNLYWIGKPEQTHHEIIFDWDDIFVLWFKSKTPEVSGRADYGSLFDHDSYARRLTHDEAIQWFERQGRPFPDQVSRHHTPTDAKFEYSATEKAEQPTFLACKHEEKNHEYLLRGLHQYQETGIPVMILPARLRNADMLAMCDAEGLIDFGRRDYNCDGHKLETIYLKKGWTFSSVTAHQHKSMADWLEELAMELEDSPIRIHVRLTAKGRVEACRLALLLTDDDHNIESNSHAVPDKNGSKGVSAKQTEQSNSKESEELNHHLTKKGLTPDTKAPYMPADWFGDKFGIPSTRLRSALRSKRLAAKNISDRNKRPRYHYSVVDARRLWPDDGIYLPDDIS